VAALGYTQQLPTEDRYLLQRKELEDRIAVLLGGRAAEEIIFNEISSGASNDLERATDIARQMVMELGMSESVGLVTFSRRRGTFMQTPELESREYSETTAQNIDAEVRRLLTEGYATALQILRRDRQFLEAIARKLLENEVMDREELREILGLPPEKPGEAKPEVGHVPDHAAD
jgi:cell division protease FtsH